MKVCRSSSAAVPQRFRVPLCSPGCVCPLAACHLHFQRLGSDKCSYSAESFEACVCRLSEIGSKVDSAVYCRIYLGIMCSASNFIVAHAPISHYITWKYVAMILETLRTFFATWFIFLFYIGVYIPFCEFSWLLIFLADFSFLVEFCLEAQSRLNISPSWYEISFQQEWVEQRPGILSSAAYFLCILPHLMNIQSCTGSLSGFQSLSFFRFRSLAMALFPTYTRTQEYKKTHAYSHVRVPHQHNRQPDTSLQSWIFIHTCFRQKVFSRFHCYLDGTLDLSSFV